MSAIFTSLPLLAIVLSLLMGCLPIGGEVSIMTSLRALVKIITKPLPWGEAMHQKSALVVLMPEGFA
jgi:hypothetical protein